MKDYISIDWSKELQSIATERVNQYTNSNITFIWFLLWLSGIFLGFGEIKPITEYLLLWSIISLTLWYYIFFMIERGNVLKIFKAVDILKNKEDQSEESINTTLKDDVNHYWISYKLVKNLVYLIDFWIILFLFAMISLI